MQVFRSMISLVMLSAGKAASHNLTGALGGTRTPTMLLTATSRQRVYQFRHERLGDRHGTCAGPDQDRINGADVTNQGWRDKAREHRGSAEPRIGTGLAGAG